MPADESLAYYWASIGFSAAGVILFLWLLRTPRPGKPGNGSRATRGSETAALLRGQLDRESKNHADPASISKSELKADG